MQTEDLDEPGAGGDEEDASKETEDADMVSSFHAWPETPPQSIGGPAWGLRIMLATHGPAQVPH